MLEAVLIYKFTHLSRQEIEAMFGLSELKQTRFYQEAEAEGRQKEGASLVLKLLRRKTGSLPTTLENQIQALSTPQLEALAEALLDFTTPNDLTRWLTQNT